MNTEKFTSNPDEKTTGVAGQKILSHLLRDYDGPVGVRLWNGETVGAKTDVPCTLHLHNPSVLRQLILHQDLVRLAESYLQCEVDVEGDMEKLFDLTDHAETRRFSLTEKWQLLQQALRLPRYHRSQVKSIHNRRSSLRHNSRESIAHHYDVSNDFYRLWLDPEMVYSCAYFRHPNESLANAQLDKLDYICRKLRLQPGQTLLDIGCGWGALAIWAARNYGVNVHGITLSQQQYQYAQNRVDKEELAEQVSIELLDYRHLPENAAYDRVVSVGMFEHIGVANFPQYFETVKRVLKPEGLFLNHGITNDSGWQDTPLTRFINQYVFPDGELERVSVVENAMEKAGFEIIDVESLRRHYALTLRQWVRELESKREQAIIMVGEATYRIWRLYMAGCAYYFDEGSINVYQILAGSEHQPLTLPLRRDDLYQKECRGKTCKCATN